MDAKVLEILRQSVDAAMTTGQPLHVTPWTIRNVLDALEQQAAEIARIRAEWRNSKAIWKDLAETNERMWREAETLRGMESQQTTAELAAAAQRAEAAEAALRAHESERNAAAMAFAALVKAKEAAEADAARWLLSCQMEQTDAAWLRAELSTAARLNEAERLAAAGTVLELSQANIELAALNADLTERAQELSAALAAVPVAAINTVVRSLDDGVYDDVSYYAVVVWLEQQEAAQHPDALPPDAAQARIAELEAALARVEEYAVYWRDAADEWQDAGSRIMSFAEWLAAQPPHAGEEEAPDTAEICPSCNGRGYDAGGTCHRCGGLGYIDTWAVPDDAPPHAGGGEVEP